MLRLWNDGATKETILDFVERVTDRRSGYFIPAEERIAVFDNDGTLWCEKPMPIQLDFIIRRLAHMARENKFLRVQQPWQAAYQKDFNWLNDAITKHYNGDDSQLKVLFSGMVKSYEGLNVDAYLHMADRFLHTAENPKFNKPYLETAYAPMIELLEFLQMSGFTNYIVSGGDRDFMRPVSLELYNVPSERVIGSSNGLKYYMDGDVGRVKYNSKPDIFNDGAMKPLRIWGRVGRRPILAFGNSNGDIPMLQYAHEPTRQSLSLLLKHDDEREEIYSAGAEKAIVAAKENHWTIVSMRQDWQKVFAG